MNVDPDDFTPETLRKIAPKCGDCADGGDVALADGAAIYPHRPDLHRARDGSQRWWWRCATCGGYVGTHQGTLKPLGLPAGKETRRAREAAHAAFDPLWQKRQRLSGLTKAAARGRGYKWLADKLGVDRKDCHIGMMNAATARRVADVCNQTKGQRQHDDVGD